MIFSAIFTTGTYIKHALDISVKIMNEYIYRISHQQAKNLGLTFNQILDKSDKIINGTCWLDVINIISIHCNDINRIYKSCLRYIYSLHKHDQILFMIVVYKIISTIYRQLN